MVLEKKLAKAYDYILVGNTLGSLALGQRLKSQGHAFCILDSDQMSSHGLKYFPAIEQMVYTHLPANSKPADHELFMAGLRDLALNIADPQVVSGPPLTFDKGQFKSFIGFGDGKVEAMDEYRFLCDTETLIVPEQPEQLWQELSASLEDHVFADQQLTDLIFTDSALVEVVTNGKNTIKGHQFVFFNHLDWFLDRLAHHDTSLAPKLKKLKWYSSISLIFHHPEQPQAFEYNTPYLLMGSKEQPCLGQFSQLGGKLISRWQSYISAEMTRDSETVGTAVKEIKKQVKRAFGEVLGTLANEQIIIHQAERSDLTPFMKKLSSFNNLYLCSPAVYGARGWLHELLSTAAVAGSEPRIEPQAPLSL